MKTFRNYIVQYEVEMVEGPSINALADIWASSEQHAISLFNESEHLIEQAIEYYGGSDYVQNVEAQLAWVDN